MQRSPHLAASRPGDLPAGHRWRRSSSAFQQRDRPYERQIAPDYLEQLNALYETWFQSFSPLPGAGRPADRLDFVSNNSHLDLITEKITERLQGKEIVTFD
jgi:deoxyadenosine/deoxycytidine kinase